MANEKTKSVFETLNAIDCSEHIEKKGDLSYLSWPWAIAEVLKRYPDTTWEIERNPETNLPYFADEHGIMCYTSVTIEGITKRMWLYVMDSSNKAMTFQEQKYTVFNKFKKINEEKLIAKATMADINKTVMRCLVKNLAVFGLGLYIYAGEDLPDSVDESSVEQSNSVKGQKVEPVASQDDMFKSKIEYLIKTLNLVEEPKSADDIAVLWKSNSDKQSDAEFKAAITFTGNYLKNKK